VDVAHYFIQPDQVGAEIARLRQARDAVIEELRRLQNELTTDAPPVQWRCLLQLLNHGC
jgi:phosphotransferase system enzyme I (PtsI)